MTPSLLARLKRLRVNVANALASARVPESGEIDTERLFTFWEALGASSAADLGLRVAATTTMHEYDVAWLAALHSPDVRTSLEKVARYKRLCGPKDMLIETRAKDVHVSTVWRHAERATPIRLVDATLASLLVLLQRGSGQTLAPKRIELARHPSDEAMLMRFFGCTVRFRAARDVLVLERRQLDVPFVTHNADLLTILIPPLEARLRPPGRRSFVEEVRAAVARRMAGERPSVEKVAREMALSTRTLQRRLAEAGQSYQKLLDDVRHRRALELLKDTRVDVIEVAYLLGFEELNSFTRAFRAWEQTTPREWRDSMQNGAMRFE